ncbi:NAD(P)-binding domain-containing protein [Psychrobacillus sp. NPDC096623]|uniref:NAD(P)-binding domain-containing protein n=1 Tax=Psychrobacillus sp. NPDC096623 TaxID=3364492 RepID=UPI0038126C1A
MKENVGSTIKKNIGIIGFGEVGQVFANGLLENNPGVNVFVYDILLEKKETAIEEKIIEIGAKPVQRIDQLALTCDIVLSLVSSSASIHVAKEYSNELDDQKIFIDFTTSTPQDKQVSEQVIQAKKGLYVDAAIMGTVATEKNKVPLLLSGNHATETEKQLTALGFNCQVVELPNGASASIKLLRSIFMKGLEALALETMITARNYGVDKEVLESISKTLDNNDFTTFSSVLMKTHMVHKKRRMKEVSDCIKIITDANLEPAVTEGVLAFFKNSVNKQFEDNLVQTKDIGEILDAYLNKERLIEFNKS